MTAEAFNPSGVVKNPNGEPLPRTRVSPELTPETPTVTSGFSNVGHEPVAQAALGISAENGHQEAVQAATIIDSAEEESYQKERFSIRQKQLMLALGALITLAIPAALIVEHQAAIGEWIETKVRELSPLIIASLMLYAGANGARRYINGMIADFRDGRIENQQRKLHEQNQKVWDNWLSDLTKLVRPVKGAYEVNWRFLADNPVLQSILDADRIPIIRADKQPVRSSTLQDLLNGGRGRRRVALEQEQQQAVAELPARNAATVDMVNAILSDRFAPEDKPRLAEILAEVGWTITPDQVLNADHKVNKLTKAVAETLAQFDAQRKYAAARLKAHGHEVPADQLRDGTLQSLADGVLARHQAILKQVGVVIQQEKRGDLRVDGMNFNTQQQFRRDLVSRFNAQQQNEVQTAQRQAQNEVVRQGVAVLQSIIDEEKRWRARGFDARQAIDLTNLLALNRNNHRPIRDRVREFFDPTQPKYDRLLKQLAPGQVTQLRAFLALPDTLTTPVAIPKETFRGMEGYMARVVRIARDQAQGEAELLQAYSADLTAPLQPSLKTCFMEILDQIVPTTAPAARNTGLQPVVAPVDLRRTGEQQRVDPRRTNEQRQVDPRRTNEQRQVNQGQPNRGNGQNSERNANVPRPRQEQRDPRRRTAENPQARREIRSVTDLPQELQDMIAAGEFTFDDVLAMMQDLGN